MILHKLRRFRRDDQGLAVMEFAFALPVLVMILLGCFDAARFVLINQKMSRVASQSADLVAQLDVVTEAEIDDLFVAADATAEPFPLGTEGKVIISSVFRPYSPSGAAPTIVWQRETPEGLLATSHLGPEGQSSPSLPEGFSLRSGENAIIAEVFYDYQPVFFGTVFEERVLYHTSYNRPRLQNLNVISP
jgi:TadE-like protein